MKQNSITSYLLLLPVVLFMTCQRISEPLFTKIDAEHSNVNFDNSITESEAFNVNQYMYIYNGGGVAVGDINNDGLIDIYFGANQASNRLYLNKGDFKFEDITESAGVGGPQGEGVWTTGISMVDLNHDGWLDIYVNQISRFKHIRGRNHLYINNGNGTFTEQAAKYGLDLESFSQQCIFFDYDLDGDLDMYQLNHSIHDLDVYVKAEKRLSRDSLAGDRLFRNDNDYFVDVSEESGIYGGATGYGLSVAVSDLDNNGCPDIYVSNDFHENDYLYYNQCDGTFKEAITESMDYTSAFSMGNDIGDVNNDGLMDIITLDMKPEDEIIKRSSSGADTWDIYNFKLSFGYHHQYPRNMLQLNRGRLVNEYNSFSEIGQLVGVDATDWSWSVLLVDLDNDRKKDIFITNGIERRLTDLDYINYIYNEEVLETTSSMELVKKMPDGKASNYAFRNSDENLYTDVSGEWGLNHSGYSMGSAYADLDNDGDQDLIVNNLNNPATIYQNNASSETGTNFLKIILKGSELNTFGIGAKVKVTLGKESLVQEVSPVRGWLSSSDYRLNFGLGNYDNIDKVTVDWPGGLTEELTDIPANQSITFNYSNAQRKADELVVDHEEASFTKLQLESVDFNHKEDDFVDFNVERLIPHKLSTEGPKIAIGDINSDGKQDFFVGGASGQSGVIFVQTSADEGYFRAIQPGVMIEDRAKEDVDAAFFDADGDGDQDLYVVSGGGHTNEGPMMEDRLYINMGNAQFKRSVDLPKVNSSGSCIVAKDFNGDGKVDLFVGGRSVHGSYGLNPRSFVLWNNGEGRFRADDSEILTNLGMVTGAAWLKNENSLMIAGEWMPVTRLHFQGKTIEKNEVAQSSGWWNTIHASDLDNDGDMDLLVGNAGKNLELTASVEKPVRLIINDWDNNLSIDPIITHYNQGKEWIFASLDDLTKQMPPIKNRYISYTLYANHDLDQMFTEDDLMSARIKKAENFGSSVFWNDGDGSFEREDLPLDAQLSPIYGFHSEDFNGDGLTDVLSVGNFHGYSPMIGRSSSSYGSYLKGSKDRKFDSIEPRKSGFSVPGEARDIQPIVVGQERWLIVSRSNDSLLLFRVNQMNRDNLTLQP